MAREETLTIRIGSQISEALSGLNRIGQRVEKLGKDMQRTGRMMTRNFTAPIAAAGAAALGAAVRFGNAADKMLDLEQQTGLTTDQIQEFRRVTAIAGVEQDTVAEAAIRLTTRLRAAGEESLETRLAFEKLGIGIRNTDGSLRSMDELLPEIIAELQGVEDITNRNSLATLIFGRSAANLAPVLGLAADEMANARREAHDMGLVIDRETLKAANEFRKQWDTLTQTLKGSVDQLGIAVIPLMTKFVELLQDRAVPVIQELVKQVKALDLGIVTLVATIAGVFAVIGPFLFTMGKLVAVFGLALSTAGLVTAALAGLAAIAVIVARNWDEFKVFWLRIWGGIQFAVLQAIQEITRALRRLTSQMPLLADQTAKLDDDFAAFAVGSIRRTTERIRALEGQISSAGAAMVKGAEAADEMAGAVNRLGAEARNKLDDLQEWADTFVFLSEHSHTLGIRLQGVQFALAGFSKMLDVPVRQVKTLADESRKAFSDLGGALEDTAGRGVDAFASFAVGTERRISEMVKNILRQLAKVIVRMLFIEALMTAFPGSKFIKKLGGQFAGGFASGGFIPHGQFGLVAEAGRPEVVARPSFVRGPAQVMPMMAGASSGPSASDILAALGPMPRPMSPHEAATHTWYRQFISLALPDRNDRGGR